ncbi:hypothetical protein, partial [Pseudomonas coronafaciens]|uniref:hypothetical protein n=1 Tax=Pseudomonas coronafaciens TaxID=53409 RepID=UPI00196818F4
PPGALLVMSGMNSSVPVVLHVWQGFSCADEVPLRLPIPLFYLRLFLLSPSDALLLVESVRSVDRAFVSDLLNGVNRENGKNRTLA